ncbi:cysteine-rich KTR domain-containing protein [Streptococcus mutans]
MMNISITEWLLCPICKSKTRIKLRKNTELRNFPLYCPKCKLETLVNIKELKTTIIKEPDAKTQSR